MSGLPIVIPAITYEHTPSTTESLVSDQFDLAKQVAINQLANAQVYQTALSQLFVDAVMPDSDISYDFQSISLASDIESKRPEAPSTADLTPGSVNVPQPKPLTSISIPSISIPSYTLQAPINEFVYNETPYTSTLNDALQPILVGLINSGGTGLGADIEDALWARARARQDLLNERTYNEAEEYFTSRGYVVPPGALSARLQEALSEQTRADAQLNYEISIEQARLAKAQEDFIINASIAYEGQGKELFNNIANRTLEASKTTIQVIIDLYNAKINEYKTKYEGKKLTIEAEKLKVDTVVAANSNLLGEYGIDIEKYKVQVQSELEIVEQIAKVYGFKISGYEADAKVANAQLDAQIKKYQGNIEQANNQTALTLKEAEMAIQSYLGALQLTADSMKASGNISAQIAASALSAVNASASLGRTSAYSNSDSSSEIASNSSSFSEVHSYDETAVE